MTTPITTSNGTTVDVIVDEHDERIVTFQNDTAPDGMREVIAGRLVTIGDGTGFQSIPFANFGITPEALRAIATIIENQENKA